MCPITPALGISRATGGEESAVRRARAAHASASLAVTTKLRRPVQRRLVHPALGALGVGEPGARPRTRAGSRPEWLASRWRSSRSGSRVPGPAAQVHLVRSAATAKRGSGRPVFDPLALSASVGLGGSAGAGTGAERAQGAVRRPQAWPAASVGGSPRAAAPRAWVCASPAVAWWWWRWSSAPALLAQSGACRTTAASAVTPVPEWSCAMRAKSARAGSSETRGGYDFAIWRRAKAARYLYSRLEWTPGLRDDNTCLPAMRRTSRAELFRMVRHPAS